MAKRKRTKEGAHEVLAVHDSDKTPGVLFVFKSGKIPVVESKNLCTKEKIHVSFEILIKGQPDCDNDDYLKVELF